MRAPVFILILILIASTLAMLPSPARGDTWSPNPTRTITPSTTSPGFGFIVTITFTAPMNKTVVLLDEGSSGSPENSTGDKWYVPHNYTAFSITSWTASPATQIYDGRSAWIWDPDVFGPGQKITLSYKVLVAKGVAFGTYPIDGNVGRVVGGGSDLVRIKGDTSVGVIPAKLSVLVDTDKALYFGGDLVVVRASVKDPSGAPVSGAGVSARFMPPGNSIPLTEAPPGTGMYQGNFRLPQNAHVGPDWTVTVQADDFRGNTGSGAAGFEVGFQVMSMTAAADKTAYPITDTLQLTVTLKAPDGSSVSNAKVQATLSPGNAVLILKEDTTGVYRNSAYKFIPSSPLGSWSASVSATSGAVRKSADVSWNVVRAAIVLAPTLEAKSVKRLEAMKLAVVAAYPDGSAMGQTTVSATVDNQAFPGLTASTDSSGKASFVWNLGPDTPLGDHTITAKVDALTGSGQVSLIFTVLPTTLDVSLSIPQAITQGDQVRVGAIVKYADGKLATGGTASLTVASLGIQNQAMAYNQSSSRYEVSIKFTGAGTVALVVQVQDAYGNKGEASTQVTVQTRAPEAPGVNWAQVGLVALVGGVVVAAVAALGVSRMRRKTRKGPQ